MQQLKIKVCGLKNQKNISFITELGIDFIGLIFYPKSKRYVGDNSTLELKDIPESIKKIGVFVNEDISKIADIVRKFGLWAVQLHGEETSDDCRILQSKGIRIIKAFSIAENFDFNKLTAYNEVCDFFLFDTKCDNYGGSGIKFNWNLLSDYNMPKKYFLSGGIDDKDTDAIREIEDKRLFAIDINSKFEIEPGLKDVEKIRNFVNRLFEKKES